MSDILKIKSISQFHEILGLPAPEHPLISFIHEKVLHRDDLDESLFGIRFSSSMYTIMYKDKVSGSLGYGRNSYDFQEGTLIFSSPNQVFTSPEKEDLNGHDGWTLVFHPDLLLKSNLSDQMDSYTYFNYEVTEALHLSQKEEEFIFHITKQIQLEYSQNIDKHSQNLIISNLELLLNYCMRFYDRQFYTRSNMNNDLVSEFESKLKSYFKSEQIIKSGLPTSNYFGKELNMSPNYLSDLLKKETGNGIKEHIDAYVVRKAKNILLSSSQSVGEIAFSLGFEYPQSFTRMFKKKTGYSPNEYRAMN
ncbi:MULTISPECIES: AraC family transcriptional regulator [unclassified Flammeovirga]|uniref:helix-turn-helix domain-containing protein n=1 Tax=unclassified Flammeovirga TaxID=2637820 RepID=UPI0005C77528|nr:MULTISPECIES: helix-turn-helix domain-containing protein [unclassified Flammeovirga]MBD0404025.1 AraC family transcriptional regulator [Flammeovirga sp. EKP202]